MELKALREDIKLQSQAIHLHREKLEKVPCLVQGQILEHDNPVLTGIATSLSAWKGAYSLLASQKEKVPLLINTSDLLDYGIMTSADMRPLFIMSRSGESAEIQRLIHQSSGNRLIIGVTEGMQSPLGKRSDLLLDYLAEEKAFPNTLSFILSQLYALAVIFGLGYQCQFSLHELIVEAQNNVEYIATCLEIPDRIGEWLAKAKAILVDGQGYLTGTAEQFALDLHETRHAGIAVTGGIMRHGVIELTEVPGVMTVFLIPNDTTEKRKAALANELAKAGKKVVVLTDGDTEYYRTVEVVRIPDVPIELKSISFSAGIQKLYEKYIAHSHLTTIQPATVSKVTREE